MTKIRIEAFRADLSGYIDLISSSTLVGSDVAALFFESKVRVAEERGNRIRSYSNDAKESQDKLDADALLVLGGHRPGSNLLMPKITPAVLSRKFMSYGLSKLGYDMVPCDAYLRDCIKRIHISNFDIPVLECEPVKANTNYSSTIAST